MSWRGDNFDHHLPAWVKSLGGWLNDVADFCYPGICPACRAVCESGHELCPDCDEQIAALAQNPACFMCGLSLSYANAPCPNCAGRGVAHYERIIRLGKFDDPIRPLIHQLKFHRVSNVGEFLAERLLAQDHVQSLLIEADCLLPVPLHGLRHFSRGYNQAEVIARRISRATDVPVVQAAARVRDTHPQSHLHSRAERMANLRDAFELRDEKQIKGRHVIVVDDVMTTGATLRTLARALRPAKPASLSALVVAVAERDGRPVK
ncbi:MAG TPA: ComF family protein [Tepidisphaeraceae bacterium]|jgi:ComF family protein|nr:ComF family protein [Tepidisphaeraceae bacterium]